MHNLRIRVYYSDTDAQGIVYHANYLRYLDHARTEMLREMGFDLSTMDNKLGVKFVAAKLEIAYRKPAYVDELLEVQTIVDTIRKASIIYHQVILKNKAVLCEAKVVIACISANKPVAIPVQLHQELKAL